VVLNDHGHLISGERSAYSHEPRLVGPSLELLTVLLATLVRKAPIVTQNHEYRTEDTQRAREV
jgi:hypothetical protein